MDWSTNRLIFMQRRFRSIPELKKHEVARALAIENPELAAKLTAMGLLPGTTIELIRRAPFGKAYYIKVDGTRLALREDEAACILID